MAKKGLKVLDVDKHVQAIFDEVEPLDLIDIHKDSIEVKVKNKKDGKAKKDQVGSTKKDEVKIVKLTDEQKACLKEIKTVSGKIRYLDSQGYMRTEIAKLLDKRYQHVRNVLTTELKRKDVVVESVSA